MSGHKQDNLWRKLAQTYAEQYGQDLQRQAAELDEQGVNLATPEFDEKVRQQVQPEKARRKRRKTPLVLLAASLLLAILLPTMLDLARDSGSDQAPSVSDTDSSSVKDGEDSSAPDTSALPDQDTTDAPADFAGAPDAAETEPLPLPLALPANFRQTAVEQDQGETIYYLAESLGDDVVLSMRRLTETPDFSGLTRLEIHGQVVYAHSGPDYCLLTFVQDGILYEFTCRYSLQTLTELTELII